jgi:putative membrane protein
MKKILLIVIGLLSCLIWNISYAESWERSYQWSGGPLQFCGGTCLLIPLVLMIAFVSAVIIGIVYFVKWIVSAGRKHEIQTEETALDILKKRYARGEISKEDFERMKQDIV